MNNLKGKKKFKNKKISENIFFWTLLALPLLQFCIFYIGVNFNSILLAVKNYDYAAKKYVYVGIENFKTFFKLCFSGDSSMWYCLRNSLLIFAIGVCITTPLSILFSYYIYKNGKRKHQKRTASTFIAEASKILLFLPTIIPSIAIVLMFKYFGENSLPVFLNNLFHTSFRGLISSTDTALSFIIFFNVLVGFGTSMLLYTGAMSGIDESLIESGQMDGVSPARELLKIVFPVIWPTFTMQMVLSVAGIFINQASLYSFYGGSAPYVTRTFGYYLFITVSEGTMADYPYAAAVGLIFTFIATPITLLTKYLLERFGPSTTRNGKIKEVKAR